MHPTDFSWALSQIKEGRRLYRAGWRGTGAYVCICRPPASAPGDIVRNDHLVRILPGFPEGPRGQEATVVPWAPTHADLLATDWDMMPEPCNMTENGLHEVYMRLVDGKLVMANRGERGAFIMRQAGPANPN